MEMKYAKGKTHRVCMSQDYNWLFNTETGEFARWGCTIDEDPVMAPSPEILDIEISTVCHQGCKFCYKSNTSVGTNMSLEQFKGIFAKFDDNLTQIAFGIGDVRTRDGQLANPDLYEILRFTREAGVIPNITINGARMTDSDYTQLAELCGAVAVSHYSDDVCFNAVQKLHEAGLKQVNIHQLLATETLDECIDLAHKTKTDPRLKHLGAVVYLWLKPKGERNNMTPIKNESDYLRLVDVLLSNNVKFGFDSCSANNFLSILRKHYPEKMKALSRFVEPCESSLFSFYINAEGIAYPCSFSEDVVPGVDMETARSFAEVWERYCASTGIFRRRLLANNRSCPIYNLGFGETL